MNRFRWAITVLLVMLSPACSRSSGSIAALADKARAESVKWQRDAQLVQVEVNQFGFATGKSGVPDMTKAGPPGHAMFNFFSPSTQQALRVNVTLKPTLAMQVERLATPVSPYTLPIPEKFVDLDDAIAMARGSGIDRECAGASPLTSTCSVVSDAELHVYWSGTGGSGKPIWKISFGQHPSTYKIVARQVDAASGKVVTIADLEDGTLSGATDRGIRPQVVNLSNMERDFASVWKVVNDAVAKQDPLYKPCAVGLVLSLDENRDNPRAKVVLHHAYIQFARVTPSLRWDELEVHVEWTANTSATMKIGAPSRRAAPQEPIPTVLVPAKIADADVSLRKLVNLFPPDYREVYTTTEHGWFIISNTMWNITRNERRIVRQYQAFDVKHYTDFIYLWLIRQGNSYWLSEAAPLSSEYMLINRTAPSEKWVWWTRIKQHGQWQYQIVDAASDALTVECTSPPDGNSPNPSPVQQCK